MSRLTHHKSAGFTLVEMAVIAPIVILLIGGFISLIVNLTGEVLSSRGANVLTYDVQDALNRIEEDVRLSTTYLAENNVDLDVTRNGYGAAPTVQSATKFTNIDRTSAGGSPASLVLNTVVTNGNPLSPDSSIVYLEGEPSDCSSEELYSRNKPMTANIVYFVDENDTLWRRVIMPSNYIDSNAYCGDAPWQVSSCPPDFSTVVHGTYCKTNDERLVDGVSADDFNVSYFNSPDASVANSDATDPSASATLRNNALTTTQTVEVSISAEQLVAGREVNHSASVRASRLDVNATSIGTVEAITSAPDAPQPVGNVSEGHIVTFTWPRVEGATEYEVRYRFNDTGSWITPSEEFNNNNRELVVTDGNHTDEVNLQVQAMNSFGSSSNGITDTKIPLWAPILLENNWVRYSSSYNAPSYTKTSAGLVMITGLAKRTTGTISANEVLGTIPESYAPSGTLIFMVTKDAGSNDTDGRIDVRSNGNLGVNDGNEVWTSLEGISYMPANSTYSRVTPPLSNGWQDYGGSYEGYSYTLDSAGRTTTQGLIRYGSTTSGDVIYAHPTTSRPPYYELVAVKAGGYGEVGFSSGGNVVTRGYGSSWISLTTTFLSNSASTPWYSLPMENNWIRYSSSYEPGYNLAEDGVVHVRGLVKSGTSSTIATLPPGYRPAYRKIFYAANYGNFTRIDVTPGGAIIVYGTERTWVSLNTISFPAEQ